MRLSSVDDSDESSASAESGVLPVELFGDEPSLNKLKSVDLPSEFTIDQGRCFGATAGGHLNFNFVSGSSGIIKINV